MAIVYSRKSINIDLAIITDKSFSLVKNRYLLGVNFTNYLLSYIIEKIKIWLLNWLSKHIFPIAVLFPLYEIKLFDFFDMWRNLVCTFMAILLLFWPIMAIFIPHNKTRHIWTNWFSISPKISFHSSSNNKKPISG